MLRWSTRFAGNAYFLTDDYPPYSLQEEPTYPVAIAMPPRTKLNRMAVPFRVILFIPAALVSRVVCAGALLIAVASWAMITFAGRQPVPLYEAIRVVTQFQMRVSGYLVLLKAEYP